MKIFWKIATLTITVLFAAPAFANELIPKRPSKWLVHLKSGSPVETSFWAELSGTGALRVSRKQPAEKTYTKIYEGDIGNDTAARIYAFTADALEKFRFPVSDTDSQDGTNIELSLIFHRRSLTAEFIALEGPEKAGTQITQILKLLNSKLPNKLRIW